MWNFTEQLGIVKPLYKYNEVKLLQVNAIADVHKAGHIFISSQVEQEAP
jgi:hypothetical protein